MTVKNEIEIEIRCRFCGKLFFKLFKEGITACNKKGKIEVKCPRCGKKNQIKM